MTEEKKKPEEDEVTDEDLENVAGGLQAVEADTRLAAKQGPLPDLTPEGDRNISSLSEDQKSALKGIVGDASE